MAHITLDRRVATIHGSGILLVASDLHGNLADLRRMLALLDAEPDAALLLLGDLFHGPAVDEATWNQEFAHLADWYLDQSAELFREVAAQLAARPHKVASLMGNHDHAHVGGPVVCKFHPDEALAMEETMPPEERPALHDLIRGLPLIAVTDCGAAFTHATPPPFPFTLDQLAALDLGAYTDVPLYAMHRRDILGGLLWRRGSDLQTISTFLDHLHAATGHRCTFVGHGHEIVDEGFLREHARVLNLSTSFAMKRRRKTYLRLDLSRPLPDAMALRPGHELLPLYDD